MDTNAKTKTFISKAIKIHGETYDYSMVRYVNNNSKVMIICPKHGEFMQTPHAHLSRRGCPKCGMERTLNARLSNVNNFIIKAQSVHGKNTYDYSNVNYVNTNTKVVITCPNHGMFQQTPSNHLRGYGCPICATTYRASENEIKLISAIKKIWPNLEINPSSINSMNPNLLLIAKTPNGTVKIGVEYDGISLHKKYK